MTIQLSQKISLTALLVALFLAGWYFGSDTEVKAISVRESSSQLSEVSRLETELARLKRELLKKQPTNVDERKTYEIEPKVELKKSEEKSIDGVKEATEARMKNLADKLRNIEGYDHFSETNQTFENEHYDDAWAAPRTELLRNIFATSPELFHKNIKSIECRSKHCRIELYYEQAEDLNDVGSTLIDWIVKDGTNSSFITSLESTWSANEKTANFFLTDDSAAALY